MKYFKDLPNVDKSELKSYLLETSLWNTPTRFINQTLVDDTCEQARQELGPEKALELAELISSSLVMAKFLGLIEHSQIIKIKSGN